MGRPPKKDRSEVATLTLTLRLTKPDRALLDALVERQRAELEPQGGRVSAASYVLGLIKRDAREKGVEVGGGRPEVDRQAKGRRRR